MDPIEDEATQDDLEGSVAPLGRSPSTHTSRSEGVWAPVIRKGLAITLGGLALAAIGALSMAYRSNDTPTQRHLSASVPGMEALEWIALSSANESAPSHANASAPNDPVQPKEAPATTNDAPNTNGEAAPDSKREPIQSAILPDGRVVLNLATLADLQTLPGIGQKRAESILALRQRLGGLKKLSDLLRVKGIGVKSLRKLEPKITLNPPVQTSSPGATVTPSSPSPPPNATKP